MDTIPVGMYRRLLKIDVENKKLERQFGNQKLMVYHLI